MVVSDRLAENGLNQKEGRLRLDVREVSHWEGGEVQEQVAQRCGYMAKTPSQTSADFQKYKLTYSAWNSLSFIIKLITKIYNEMW